MPETMGHQGLVCSLVLHTNEAYLPSIPVFLQASASLD
jgi:hypothetical protein